jgi:methionyl-tRNA synthetase
LTREVNKYLDVKAPWVVFKTDPLKAGTTIYVALKAIDSLKILYAPILPHSSEQIHELLGYEDKLFGKGEVALHKSEEEQYNFLRYLPSKSEVERKDRWNFSCLEPGKSFLKPLPLFKVLDETVVE